MPAFLVVDSRGSNPQRVPKRVFIYGNDANDKTLSNLSLQSPEYGMTNESNFRGDFPCEQPQRVQKKLEFMDGNKVNAK